MAKQVGEKKTPSTAVNVDDLAWRLKLVGRQKKGVKDYQTYGGHAKGRRRKVAMDYVSPGDGGY